MHFVHVTCATVPSVQMGHEVEVIFICPAAASWEQQA